MLGEAALLFLVGPVGAPGAPNIPLPPGQWTATGTVLKEVNIADEPAGTTLKRPWTFKTVCQSSCHTLFLRQTLYGPSETTLTAHDGIYTATFPPVTVPCATAPGSSGLYDSYTLQWSPNRQQTRH